MTVDDLIAEISSLPGDMEVVVEGDGGWWHWLIDANMQPNDATGEDVVVLTFGPERVNE